NKPVVVDIEANKKMRIKKTLLIIFSVCAILFGGAKESYAELCSNCVRQYESCMEEISNEAICTNNYNRCIPGCQSDNYAPGYSISCEQCDNNYNNCIRERSEAACEGDRSVCYDTSYRTTGISCVSGRSAADTSASKCSEVEGFTEIAGVCFPTQTGLSSAPIYIILSNIFSWLIGIFTIIAIIAFVISGIQYLVSAGNEEQIQIAKRNAKNSLIGVIVGLSGFVILRAVVAALSGSGFLF
ncbi:MAG TPA: pilin, partial [Candidatus Moranbacteria bacterium]|nr:pilin [Candidatus Moranbacteria bacterium]